MFSLHDLNIYRYAPRKTHADFQELVNYLCMRNFLGFLQKLWKPVISVQSAV